MLIYIYQIIIFNFWFHSGLYLGIYDNPYPIADVINPKKASIKSATSTSLAYFT